MLALRRLPRELSPCVYLHRCKYTYNGRCMGKTDPGCTCFRLRSLTRRVTQLYDQVLAPSGLTVTQYSLLAHARRR